MPVSDIYRSSAFGANQLCPIFAIVIFYFGMSGTMKVKAFLVTEIIILTMYLFDLKVSAISMLCITTIIEITFSKKNRFNDSLGDVDCCVNSTSFTQ